MRWSIEHAMALVCLAGAIVLMALDREGSFWLILLALVLGS